MIMSADDDAAPDTRPKGPEDHAVNVPTGPDPVFSVSGGIGIILQSRRPLDPFGHAFPDRNIIPAGQVGRID